MLVGAEAICCYFLITSALTFLAAHFINRLFTAGRRPPGQRWVSPTINHVETHQLKGQYFVGSWVIDNLLKVSSNCSAEGI